MTEIFLRDRYLLDIRYQMPRGAYGNEYGNEEKNDESDELEWSLQGIWNHCVYMRANHPDGEENNSCDDIDIHLFLIHDSHISPWAACAPLSEVYIPLPDNHWVERTSYWITDILTSVFLRSGSSPVLILPYDYFLNSPSSRGVFRYTIPWKMAIFVSSSSVMMTV